MNELIKYIDLSKTRSFQNAIKNKLETIKHTEEDIQAAKKANPDNWQDELHIILAKKSNSDVICTRNIKHFTKFPSKLPEQLV